MRLASPRWLGKGIAIWLTAAVLVLIGTLAWFGYRAVVGWRTSAAMVANRRAGEMANLLVSAITRDMRGVQRVVLPSVQGEQFMMDPPYDVRAIAASAFARYPYPESFFAWRGARDPARVLFFERSDRPPPWSGPLDQASRFPVIVQSHPRIAKLIVDRIEGDSETGRRFSAFPLEIEGVRYQVVVRLLYRDPLREQLDAAFGFMVNLAWVRDHYFTELTQQVARIGSGTGLSIAVVDEHDRDIAAVPSNIARAVSVRRGFELMFFDPLTVGHGYAAPLWHVETGAAHDPTLAQAVRASNRTLVMLALAAAALAFGLILTLRATRESARLAELRSEFVSTVTHELKTPIATIRAIGDTLARERVTQPEARLEYAQLVVQESKRLARLVDNLLAYSRVTDVTEVYSFEPIDMASIVEESLHGFRTQLQEKQFEVRIDIPPGLPPILADHAALTLTLENVIENAIRYSADERFVEISGRREGREAVIEVRDHGIGIPRDHIDRVTQRFYRAPGSGAGGSGLGLSIVKRVVSDHRGTLSISSTVNAGTTVKISLPLATHV